MATYMLQFSYTTEAWSALTKNPQDRSIPVKELIQKVGGKFINLYYCAGDYDGVVLFEAPDDIAASAVTLVAVSAGHLKANKTTKLYTIKEALEMMKKAGSIPFAGPPRS